MGISIQVNVTFESDNPADSSVVADVMTAIGKAQGSVGGGTPPEPPAPTVTGGNGGDVPPAPQAGVRGPATRR